jgi:hypothetical protein
MQRSSIVSALLLALLLNVCFAIECRAGSIFDDDWTPPKSVQPPIAPSTPPTPSPAVPTPVPPPDPAGGLPGKRPALLSIPAKADLARSRALLKDAFAKQLSDRTPVGRRRLAQALLNAYRDGAADPADKYALLGGAMNAGKEGLSLRLCCQTADIMAATFGIDPIAAKLDVLFNLNPKADEPYVCSENLRAAAALLDPLISAENFALAARVCTALRSLAVGNPGALSLIQKRQQQVELMRLAYDRQIQQLEKLKKSPDDAAANYAVGSYFCFVQGRWDVGLPLLSKGNDPKSKALAQKELSSPKDPEELATLGDEWWNLAEGQTGRQKAKLQERAADHYRAAIAQIPVGLRKRQIEARIEAFELGESDGFPDKVAGITEYNFNKPGTLASFDVTGNAVINARGELDLSNGTPSSIASKQIFHFPIRAEFEVYCAPDGVLDINPGILTSNEREGLCLSFGDSFNRVSSVKLYGKSTKVELDPIRATQVYKVVLSIDQNHKAEVELDGKTIYSAPVPRDVKLDGHVVLSGGRGHVVYTHCIVFAPSGS